MQALFPHPPTGLSCVFEDDGRVAWAWLLGPEGECLADVWLYNRVAAPPELVLDAPPFLNAAALSRPLGQPFPTRAAEVEVTWTWEGELLLAEVRLRGVVLGRLSPGAQPGWSAQALAEGPLALPLE